MWYKDLDITFFVRKILVIAELHPMKHILTRQIMGDNYSKWIVILKEFDLEFATARSKKALVLIELISELPSSDLESTVIESLPDETLFLIDSSNPWYGHTF